MDELERALDDCLQRLTTGKANLAQCLARYPQQAAELRPMLEAALQVQRGKAMRPSGAVRNRARAKLMAHIEAHPRQPRKTPVVPRLAFVMVAVFLSLFVVGTGVAQAALPGDPLYGLKLSSERAWRAASPDPVGTDLFLADRRASELIAIKDKPAASAGTEVSEAGAEEQVLTAYADVLNRLAKETDDIDAAKILKELKAHQDELSKAGIHVPELDDIVDHGPSQNGHGQGQGQGNGNGNGNGNGQGNGNGNGHNP